MYLAKTFLVFLEVGVERWEENEKKMVISWDVLRKIYLIFGYFM